MDNERNRTLKNELCDQFAHRQGLFQRLAARPDDTLVLPGHGPEPVPLDGEIVGAPLGTVETQVDALQWPEDKFVESVTENVPPHAPEPRGDHRPQRDRRAAGRGRPRRPRSRGQPVCRRIKRDT